MVWGWLPWEPGSKFSRTGWIPLGSSGVTGGARAHLWQSRVVFGLGRASMFPVAGQASGGGSGLKFILNNTLLFNTHRICGNDSVLNLFY